VERAKGKVLTTSTTTRERREHTKRMRAIRAPRKVRGQEEKVIKGRSMPVHRRLVPQKCPKMAIGRKFLEKQPASKKVMARM